MQTVTAKQAVCDKNIAMISALGFIRINRHPQT